ncbi:MAG: insulinase family protein [Parachlamydiales bacterium]
MHPEFTVERQEPIKEINARLIQLRHKGSGARVIHIACDDPENLFCLGFRTVPENSNGVAHILEHTVLCGSKRYPVKDPFFSMTRRSLNTFMNAMTGPDMTFYPAASQVKEDFYNLLDVYLDAVFFPNLLELSFKQEGHRLAWDGKELSYEGIVFNEMKGALASPDARIWKTLAKALYPDSPYGFESGGDPKQIPTLTYEGLKAFHRTYYDPSRCLFFFYGNLPLEGHLERIHERVLKGVKGREPPSPIPHQKRFAKPVAIEGRYPCEEGDRHMVWIGFLTCSATEPLEILALSVLEIALMGSDAAPLKRALLESGLCQQAFSFFEPDLLDVPLCIGTRGTPPGKGEALERLILEELRKIAEEGSGNRLVEGAIHQLEFDRLEIAGEGEPYGLTLFERTVPLLLHGGDPKDGLEIHTLFQRLRERFADPGYLGLLIHRYLLDNPHRVRLDMVPDPKLDEEEEEEEGKRLKEIQAGISAEALEKLREEGERLTHFQEEQEGADLEILPKIEIGQIPREVVDYPLERAECGDLTVFAHTTFTNEILYAQLQYPLPPISEEELPYLRLLTGMLAQVGCGGRSAMENLAYIQEHTGGVGSDLSLNVALSGPLLPMISVGGKALGRKGEPFFKLLGEMARSADFTDKGRIEELMMQHLSQLENTLTQRAMSYATLLAGAPLSAAGAIQERWYGIDYLQFIRGVSGVSERLTELYHRLFSRKPDLVVGCGPEQLTELFNRGFYGLDEVGGMGGKGWEPSFALPTIPSQGRLIASPVAFTCRALKSLPYLHPDAPAMLCLAKLLNNQTLHREIREKGGAYGAGSRYDPSLATFHFYTYRDPHLKESLAAMDLAVGKVARGEVEQRDLEEAILGVVQKMDTPVSPGNRAALSYGRWLVGKERGIRQAFRDRLLQLSGEDLIGACRNHLAPQMEKSTVVSFAGEELLKGSGLPASEI